MMKVLLVADEPFSLLMQQLAATSSSIKLLAHVNGNVFACIV
jgi:hypothetical protein